jgi:hypothetical protein
MVAVVRRCLYVNGSLCFSPIEVDVCFVCVVCKNTPSSEILLLASNNPFGIIHNGSLFGASYYDHRWNFHTSGLRFMENKVTRD